MINSVIQSKFISNPKIVIYVFKLIFSTRKIPIDFMLHITQKKKILQTFVHYLNIVTETSSQEVLNFIHQVT